jgi:hypothetical protein
MTAGSLGLSPSGHAMFRSPGQSAENAENSASAPISRAAPDCPRQRFPLSDRPESKANQSSRAEMADQHAASGGHPAMDYAEHEATYKLFLKLTKFTIVFLVLLMIFMAVTLV